MEKYWTAIGRSAPDSCPWRSGYLAYEQRGGFGTDHRPLKYGLEPNGKYKPVRLKNVTG